MAEYIEREAALSAQNKSMNLNEMRERLKRIPTADVRPVVRGKWIEHYEPYNTGEEWIEAQYGYECSICGRWEYEKEPFCNCGADMRKTNDEKA